MLTAKDIMNKPLINVDAETTLKEVARVMAKNNIGCVVILSKEGFLEGIITERDIIKLIANNIDLDNTRVGEVMNREIITCSLDARVLDVAKMMKEKNIRRVVVVNQHTGKAEGIITSKDLVTFMST